MRANNYNCFVLVIFGVLLIIAGQAHAAALFLKDAELHACLQDLAGENYWEQPQGVTNIKCHSKSIRSLQGLESFINLEHLSLYNNRLEHIDVELSAFKKLKTLNLSRNNLTYLSITHLPKLEKMYLFDNGIKTLNLTHLTKLKILKVNNNKIETLNYSHMLKLEKMYIFNNQLETINIHDLPSLQYMDCRQNPMPDSLYDDMDKVDDIAFLHDGNAEDW